MVMTGPIMQPSFAGRYPLLAVELSPVMNCTGPGTAPQEAHAPSLVRLLHEYRRLDQRVTAGTIAPGRGVA